MDQLITETGNVEKIGVFICKIRETLLNCSPIKSLEDRKSSSLFTICLFVCLCICMMIDDNNHEKELFFLL